MTCNVHRSGYFIFHPGQLCLAIASLSGAVRLVVATVIAREEVAHSVAQQGLCLQLVESCMQTS